MPTGVTHAVVGLGVGYLLAPTEAGPWYYAATLTLGLLPDIDVLAFPLGIPYHSRFGHRGFTHSLAFALLVGLLAALPAGTLLDLAWWSCWLAFSAALVSHTLLDALTDGGLGVALFSPLDDRRLFFPWRPIRVCPIGLAVFSRWGLRALRSEIAWVWLPLGAAVSVVAAGRNRA